MEGPALLETLRAIGHRHTADADPLDGPLAPAVLLACAAEPRTVESPFAIARPYTIAFLTPGAEHTDALRDDGRLPGNRRPLAVAPGVPVHGHRLPGSAGEPAVPDGAHGTDIRRLERARPPPRAAFLGHRPDRGDGDFYDFAALHHRTIYLDALLLGTVQRDHIDELTDSLSGVFEGPKLGSRVAVLERHIAGFRSTYWRQHLTAHGPANELLLAYQAQYRLPDPLREILSEAADYARLVQTQDSQQIAGALGVLTILGLPLGTALSVLQVLDDHDPGHLLAALGAAALATAIAFTSRYGRLVLIGPARSHQEPGRLTWRAQALRASKCLQKRAS